MNKIFQTAALTGAILLCLSGSAVAQSVGYGGGGGGGGNGGGGGGGNGPIVGSFGGFGGQVLGASSTTVPRVPAASSNVITAVTPVSCTALLTSYMRIGSKKNNPVQVMRLQIFLKAHGYTVDINGLFDLKTFNAVEKFQSDHMAEVLGPWGISAPTGYVFKTTLWEVNKMACPTLGVAAPNV